MRTKIYLVLSFFLIATVLADQKIHNLTETVQFSTQKQDSDLQAIFSLASVKPQLKEKEWYAFVKLQIPQRNFVDNIYLELRTVSIATKLQSQVKVKCVNTGEHLSDCFIGSNQIDAQKEYLSIKLSFLQIIAGKISIEIDGVKTLKLNQGYRLQKGEPAFSRILRLDVSSFASKFDFLVCEMKPLYSSSDFQELYYFLISKEMTPPNHYRYQQISQNMWGNNQQSGYTFLDLQQAEVLTFTIMMMASSIYEMKCSTVGGGEGKKQTLQLEVSKSYHQIYKPNKNYHLKLPTQRKTNIGYMLSIESLHFGEIILTYLKMNNKLVNQTDLVKMGKQSNLLAKERGIQIWLNQTYTQVQFGVMLVYGFILKIQIHQYNTELIELKQNKIWSDTLMINQTEYLYFVINSKNGTDKISFDVQFGSLFKGNQLQLSFQNCVQSSVELCKQTIYSNDSILQTTAMRPLNPKITNYPQHKGYSFLNLMLTMYERKNNLYESIIVISVSSSINNALYAILWHSKKPLQQLRQNNLIRAFLPQNALHTYYFNAIDAQKIHFARIDFLFEANAEIIVSTELFDLQSQNRPKWEEKEVYYRFENSITIPNVKFMTNYYVYIKGYSAGSYRLRLSFGYNTDNTANHPISYLSVGERSKTQATLQPKQILFIEVKGNKMILLTLQNTVTLKFCFLQGSLMPKSHKDVVSSKYCTDFKTINSFFVFNSHYPATSYVAIQNEQNVSALVKITTEAEEMSCFPVQMGEKHTFNRLWQKKNTSSCIIYPISHKGEIQVTSDLNNPQLQGVTHPVISIGKQYKYKMATNIKVISAEEVQQACKKQYDQCHLLITLQAVKQIKPTQILVTVFASYTNRPLMLIDGIGHPTQLAKGEIKHFKYALTLARSILVTLKNHWDQNEYTIYAKLVNIKQKFQYPDAAAYKDYINAKDKTNLSQVYISNTNWVLGAPNIKIDADKVTKYCSNLIQVQCYLLLTVVNNQNQQKDFTIQITQTVHHIKLGNTENAYLAKGEFDYYNFYNYNNDSNILFLVSSHASICHKLSLSEGNNQFNITTDTQRQNEVFLQKAKIGWYTMTVYATEDCYYSIQASSSQKKVAELTFGYGTRLNMLANQKRYFLIRNQNLQMIKLIGGIDKNQTSEMILRGIPVTDNEMSDFWKFINGEIEVGKKNKLEYAWTHRNHLVMRSTDAKYCKDCFICIEVEAVRDVNGFLAMSSNNLQNMQMNSQSYMYDILLKGESFTWIYKYLNSQSIIQVNLQAGQIQVEVLQNDTKILDKKQLKFDKVEANNNIYAFQSRGVYTSSYIVIKVTATQISDYSLIYKHQRSNGKQNTTIENFEIGRPKYLSLSNNSYCFQGQSNNDFTQFVLVLKDEHYGKGAMKDTDLEAKNFGQKLVVNASINEVTQQIKVQRIKNNFLISFEDKIGTINKPYKLCLSLNSQSTVIYRANLMLLGNLNYFTENEAIHIRRNANLTLISDGKGVIEMDECSSRATLVLSNRYDGLTKSTSNLNHRRVVNNYVTFSYNGPVYIGANTDDFVTLRWKNYHTTSFNGFGYDYFSASSFRLHQNKTMQDLSLTIKPLIIDQDQRVNLPQLLQLTYNIYIAKQQSDLYNAMNCERGVFMHFIRKITVKSDMQKQLLVQLNNLKDVRKLFSNLEYVLINVKASLDVKWKNNVTENYRFYYPYQQLLITQAKPNKVVDNDKKIVVQQKVPVQQSKSSLLYTLFIIISFLLALAVVAFIIVYLRRKYKTPRLVEEDLPNMGSGFTYKEAVELPERSSQPN